MEASRSETPTNGFELRNQSLKTGATGPRGPETAFVCPSRELVADATPRSHFVGWGVLASSAGIGGPRSLQHKSPPADTAGRAGWCWLLGLQRPHVGGLGTLRPRRHVELDRLTLSK